ncbi:MAG: hypothetical protein WCA27_33375 [Candidatus Sulfotelmatobacter sp.]
MTPQQGMIERLVLSIGSGAALLFLPAGSVRFWQGWMFLVTVLGFWIIVSLYLLRREFFAEICRGTRNTASAHDSGWCESSELVVVKIGSAKKKTCI